MTPAELFDALDHAITEAGPTILPFHRIAIRLTEPTVTIGPRRWSAARHTPEGYGYSLRQVRQMREALIPILSQQSLRLEQLVLAAIADGAPLPIARKYP